MIADYASRRPTSSDYQGHPRPLLPAPPPPSRQQPRSGGAPPGRTTPSPSSVPQPSRPTVTASHDHQPRLQPTSASPGGDGRRHRGRLTGPGRQRRARAGPARAGVAAHGAGAALRSAPPRPSRGAPGLRRGGPFPRAARRRPRALATTTTPPPPASTAATASSTGRGDTLPPSVSPSLPSQMEASGCAPGSLALTGRPRRRRRQRLLTPCLALPPPARPRVILAPPSLPRPPAPPPPPAEPLAGPSLPRYWRQGTPGQFAAQPPVRQQSSRPIRRGGGGGTSCPGTGRSGAGSGAGGGGRGGAGRGVVPPHGCV